MKPPSTFNLDEVLRRRQVLINKIKATSSHHGHGTGLILIPSPAVKEYISASRFRPDSYFLYLTGFREPEGLLIIDVREKKTKCILFLRPNDEKMEIWDGARLGIKKAKSVLAMDEVYNIADYKTKLATLMEGHTHLYHAFGRDTALDAVVVDAMQAQRSKVRQGIAPIAGVMDFRVWGDEMRLIKSPWEINQMRYACKVSAAVMTDTMAAVRSGMGEQQLMGQLLKGYYEGGLFGPSYTPIVGAGKNACVLHYIDNNAPIPKDSMVLMDAAGEYNGYCADITRTVPSSGRFSSAQRAIYEIVLQAHHQSMQQVQVGQRFNEYHNKAVEVIIDGLRQLKLLKGSKDHIMEKKLYTQFYMHSAGHFLGGDTHDVGAYRNAEGWRILEAGMILTVEPGIYIRPHHKVPEKFHNIGIRLEDDVLVTPKGPENMTIDAPIEIADVEALFRR